MGLLDTVTRAPSTEPVDTTMERGAPTLTTDTVTYSVLALLPTPVSPPPMLPGLPRVSTVLSATTGARGPLRLMLRPIPTTAMDTATDVPTVTDMVTVTDTMAVTTVMDTVMATATATTVKLVLSC